MAERKYRGGYGIGLSRDEEIEMRDFARMKREQDYVRMKREQGLAMSDSIKIQQQKEKIKKIKKEEKKYEATKSNIRIAEEGLEAFTKAVTNIESNNNRFENALIKIDGEISTLENGIRDLLKDIEKNSKIIARTEIDGKLILPKHLIITDQLRYDSEFAKSTKDQYAALQRIKEKEEDIKKLSVQLAQVKLETKLKLMSVSNMSNKINVLQNQKYDVQKQIDEIKDSVEKVKAEKAKYDLELEKQKLQLERQKKEIEDKKEKLEVDEENKNRKAKLNKEADQSEKLYNALSNKLFKQIR